jgi:hypothetical protein
MKEFVMPNQNQNPNTPEKTNPQRDDQQKRKQRPEDPSRMKEGREDKK